MSLKRWVRLDIAFLVAAWACAAAVLWAKRPQRPPGAANLDTAHELADAWFQYSDGLQVRGHFSYALLNFHPGPVYEWAMVAGGAVAAALSSTPWFPYGAWIGTLAVIGLALTTGWWALRRAHGMMVACGATAGVLGWQALVAPGEWFAESALGQQLWGTTLTAGLAAAGIACAWAGLMGWRPGSAWALLWGGLLVQAHTMTAALGVLVSLVAVAGVLSEKSRALKAAAGAAAVAGWWWLPWRVLADGPLFWMPDPLSSPLQTGYWPEPPMVEAQWAAAILAGHTLLPWWLAAPAALAIVAWARARVGRTAALFALAVAVVAAGSVALAWPQQYTGYQTVWVGAVWFATFGGIIGAWARRLPGRIGAIAMLVAVAGTGAWFASQESSLSFRSALTAEQGAFPYAELDRVVHQHQTTGLPVVLSVGDDPPRNFAVTLYLEVRGVPVCQVSVHTPTEASRFLDHLRCSSQELARTSLWITTSEGTPSAPPYPAVRNDWGTGFQWSATWADWQPSYARSGR